MTPPPRGPTSPRPRNARVQPRPFALLLFTCLTLLNTACATIMNSRTQEVELSTSPPHARVFIDDQELPERTPTRTQLTCRSAHFVRVEKEGYESTTALIESRFSWWILGNLPIPGGSLLILIDAAWGNGYKLVPKSMAIDLDPIRVGTRGNTSDE